jgi:hypothetical protein
MSRPSDKMMDGPGYYMVLPDEVEEEAPAVESDGDEED